ncbi:MAG: universal stress protein [Candidatus Kapaibacterium sp.]
MKTYGSILFPTDFSHCSDSAVDAVCDLAQTLGAELHLLHVVEPIDVYATRYGSEQALYFDLMKQMRTGAHEDLEALKKTLAARGLHPVAVIREGKPADEIVEYAKTHGIGMICMSTHGWSGFKHLLLGSTTERVLRHSPCPMFVLRCETTAA